MSPFSAPFSWGTQNCQLLVTQSDDWIDARCTARRDVARQERDRAKQNAHSSEREGVRGLYAEEQSYEKPSKAYRGNDSETKTGERHSQSVPHNQTQDLTTAGTQGHSNPDFVRPANHFERHKTVDANNCQEQGQTTKQA